MEFTEIESLAKDMIAIVDEANVKRKKFKDSDQINLMEQSLGEVLGAGKCLQLLVARYPTEMNIITAPEGE